MDDKIIKDVYDVWMEDGTTSSHENAFRDQAINDIEADIMLGFYAGFKTAERLAKIEVLDELMKAIAEKKLSNVQLIAKVGFLIYELKEGK